MLVGPVFATLSCSEANTSASAPLHGAFQRDDRVASTSYAVGRNNNVGSETNSILERAHESGPRHGAPPIGVARPARFDGVVVNGFATQNPPSAGNSERIRPQPASWDGAVLNTAHVGFLRRGPPNIRIYVTETSQAPLAAGETEPGARGGLNAKLLPELKAMATSLGVKGTSGMRKQSLIEAIRAAQTPAAHAGGSSARQASEEHPRKHADEDREAAAVEQARARLESRQERVAEAGEPSVADEVGARLAELSKDPQVQQRRRQRGNRQPESQSAAPDAATAKGDSQERRTTQANPRRADGGFEEDGTSRRSRRRRSRDRQGRRNNRSGGGDLSRFEDTVVREDDVLVEIAGILDVLDNYAFVRTSGYLPGPNDAYVSLSVVRKNDLRKGDVITGAIRAPREGERKEKYNPLVRLDTVNGVEPERMKGRPEFNKLTPLYPQERLRMETSSTNMTGRIVDLMSPIGKGQRGLIVSPPKAGKTMVMQNIANAITANNPEVYLMVVLVDERPEEVTDFQRTTSAEVIASTFDRPADEHTVLAELAVERAKRLVELGHDVVILLDGITRLSRAYNQSAPASGRILSGGVDSSALYPPKKFFGAARNIENGGSLTILATALVETGSKMDEVIFEEFKGTGNMELRLSRQLADKRIFPAIDVDGSGTRREELLMGRQELDIIWKLRRVLSGLDDQQALEMLLKQLRKSNNNAEFLVQISRTTPGGE